MDQRRCDPLPHARRTRAGMWLVALVLCGFPALARAQDGQAPAAQARKDAFWSNLKNLQVGPVTLDVGGKVQIGRAHV